MNKILIAIFYCLFFSAHGNAGLLSRLCNFFSTNTFAPEIIAAMPPEMSLSEKAAWSGNFNLNILFRNAVGARWQDLDFVEALRIRAYRASVANRKLRTLEITNGLPFTSTTLSYPRGARRYGDFLIHGSESGSRDGVEHPAPDVEAIVITPADMIEAVIKDQISKSSSLDSIDREYLGEGLTATTARLPTREQLRQGYQEAKDAGRISVREGEVITLLQSMIKNGEKVDLLISHELAWTWDRIRLLQAIQKVLQPGGRAFLSLKWWSPKGEEGQGTQEYIHFADTFREADGLSIQLVNYLTTNYPQAFEIAYYPGATTLIVKGTDYDVTLPKMEATLIQGTTRNGFPILEWKLR